LCLPAYSNDVISLMKSTALASTITLLDMMGIARTIVAELGFQNEVQHPSTGVIPVG
jgi:ABC-type arginine/histidine transport system permease subunit